MTPDRIIEMDVSQDAIDHLPYESAGVVYSEQLVERVLNDFTNRGDLVFDPFAGFGTTLMVARRMGRPSIGIELLPERAAFIRARLESVVDPGSRPVASTSVIEHDSLDLAHVELPPIDFSLSSPPYMTQNDHPENPLDGYRSLGGDYERYLEDLARVYEQVSQLLVPDGVMVINVATLVVDGHETPLANDLYDALSNVLTMDEVIEVRGACTASWLGSDYLLVCATA